MAGALRHCRCAILLRTELRKGRSTAARRAVMGQSRHFGRRRTTSGLPPSTDIVGVPRHVAKVPTAVIFERQVIVPKRGSRHSSTAALIGFTNDGHAARS